ncbi:MAG: addiction module antidote protein, HigA family [Candidatus Muproteobacteria bacterium RBG_16_62_13]|uniref:Addiction module antidote protein, HigA family n=1 Tax=Candidatus Muproteobacteria bacterium RBG_16_62_13 TaxID=1817756 RepID=A0A1F6T4W1_9PROT|nr:MAG: addiction module antidote protein, HigA family [Candidatus Muproteobacteria bacterium RBG_16_62_13]
MPEYPARGRRRPPTHPGELLREDILPAMGIAVSEFARRIGVSRQVVHRILAETHGLTPEMALRIGRFVGNGPRLWLRMQQEFDLWSASRVLKRELSGIEQYRDLAA